VSGETANLCRGRIAFREVDRVRVVGRTSPVTIFEPIGALENLGEEKKEALSRFANGLALYRKCQLREARQIFAKLAPEDPVAQVFLQRIEALERSPLPDSWDGTFDLTEK
jgi:adenylate cyclase